MSTIRSAFVTTLLAVLALVFVGCSHDEADKSTASGPKPSYFKENLETATSTVEAVDAKTREITIRNKDGDLYTLLAGPEVKNFDQIQKGDHIEAKYYEAFAIDVHPAGSADVTNSAEQATARTAQPGDKPAGIDARQVKVVATVQKIDIPKQLVTLRGSDGKEQTIKVRDPKNIERLNNLKIGDKVVMTYTEALAVSVKPVQ